MKLTDQIVDETKKLLKDKVTELSELHVKNCDSTGDLGEACKFAFSLSAIDQLLVAVMSELCDETLADLPLELRNSVFRYLFKEKMASISEVLSNKVDVKVIKL